LPISQEVTGFTWCIESFWRAHPIRPSPASHCKENPVRKTVLPASEASQRSPIDAWLDIENLAAADVSSEDTVHPFEAALHGGDGEGWRASGPGPQIIRLRFDKPTVVRRIHLEFREAGREHSQEFCFSATSVTGEKHQIARQQWNFSPTGSTTEVEDFSVNLPDVADVTLEIDPGRHDRDALATLQSIAIG
jgi:hypothetical protein